MPPSPHHTPQIVDVTLDNYNILVLANRVLWTSHNGEGGYKRVGTGGGGGRSSEHLHVQKEE